MKKGVCLWASYIHIRVSGKEQTLLDVEGNEIKGENIMVAVIPTIGGMFFVATIGLVIFIFMARKKRSLHGTYSPQKEEFQAPILEMTEVFKVPPHERLI